MPTRQGSKPPGETYLPSVVLFEDLPRELSATTAIAHKLTTSTRSVVTLLSGIAIKGPLETLLLALGVRKHVELQLVFTRLLGAEGTTSSHVDVLRYLCSVRDALSATELERLRRTAWLPKEGEPKVEVPPGPDGTPRRPKTARYPADQLFEASGETV